MDGRDAALTRRQMLAGTAALGTLGMVGVASASHQDEQPDYVTLTYDEDIIKRYQPLLVTDESRGEYPVAYHAVVADSAESDYRLIVGFHYYATQRGVTGLDSHLYDREPVYVLVDPDASEVVEVWFSAYHWIRGERDRRAVVLDDERPVAHIYQPHHHHSLDIPTEDDIPDAHSPPLENLLNSYPNWLNEGLEGEILPGAVYNPFVMESESDWWQNDALHQAEIMLKRVYLTLGFAESDLVS